MILGYKKQFPWGTPTDFKRKILEDIKLHTMREDAHDRWHEGRKIQHAHGVRTKSFDNFHNNECTGTQRIYIGKTKGYKNHQYWFYNGNRYGVIVDKKRLNSFAIAHLAYNDGFDSVDDFFRWFQNGFKGKIIHWTPLKY
jgi:hypothetical protein